jgi:hypothetical protein
MKGQPQIIAYLLVILNIFKPQNCIYLQRLSKKSYFSIFPNFAYNKIKYLEATKSPILGFSTVSQLIADEP